MSEVCARVRVVPYPNASQPPFARVVPYPNASQPPFARVVPYPNASQPPFATEASTPSAVEECERCRRAVEIPQLSCTSHTPSATEGLIHASVVDFC